MISKARKFVQIAVEMKRYNLSELRISETQRMQTEPKRLASRELLLYSDHEEEIASHERLH